MNKWDSSNHFKCIHYDESSWCSEMKSRIWENDPCSEFKENVPTCSDTATEVKENA